MREVKGTLANWPGEKTPCTFNRGIIDGYRWVKNVVAGGGKPSHLIFAVEGGFSPSLLPALTAEHALSQPAET